MLALMSSIKSCTCTVETKYDNMWLLSAQLENNCLLGLMTWYLCWKSFLAFCLSSVSFIVHVSCLAKPLVYSYFCLVLFLPAFSISYCSFTFYKKLLERFLLDSCTIAFSTGYIYQRAAQHCRNKNWIMKKRGKTKKYTTTYMVRAFIYLSV